MIMCANIIMATVNERSGYGFSGNRGNFWGLVEQRGPWAQTPRDKANVRGRVGPVRGGGLGYGGTRSAGHGYYGAMINPYQQDGSKPPPAPSKYAQRRVTVAPLDIFQKKGVVGKKRQPIIQVNIGRDFQRGGRSDQGTQIPPTPGQPGGVPRSEAAMEQEGGSALPSENGGTGSTDSSMPGMSSATTESATSTGVQTTPGIFHPYNTGGVVNHQIPADVFSAPGDVPVEAGQYAASAGFVTEHRIVEQTEANQAPQTVPGGFVEGEVTSERSGRSEHFAPSQGSHILSESAEASPISSNHNNIVQLTTEVAVEKRHSGTFRPPRSDISISPSDSKQDFIRYAHGKGTSLTHSELEYMFGTSSKASSVHSNYSGK